MLVGEQIGRVGCEILFDTDCALNWNSHPTGRGEGESFSVPAAAYTMRITGL